MTVARSALYVAVRWGFGSLVAGVLIALPTPPAVPTAPPPGAGISNVVSNVLPLPTPSLPLPVHVSPPPLSGVLASPTPQATAPAGAPTGGGAARQSSQSSRQAATGGSQVSVPIPFTSIVVAASPLDIAMLGALATLPLLFGLWLLLFGRTFNEARRAREAHVRLTLAAELGIKPRELTGMSVKTLFGLREKAAFDQLTGVLRRAAGITAADREVGRAKRNRTPLAVAFVDIDDLQVANAKGGRQAGDRLLRELAAELKAGLRSQDFVFRYAGDEFVCVLPDTDLKAARAKLSTIQMAAARAGIRVGIGVAEFRRSDDVVALFARADADLYDFKAHRGEIVELPAPGTESRGRRDVTA